MPSPAVTLSTSRGATRTPSLAMVWKTDAAWMAVTDSPCPNATVAFFVPLQVFEDSRRPRDSPG